MNFSVPLEIHVGAHHEEHSLGIDDDTPELDEEGQPTVDNIDFGHPELQNSLNEEDDEDEDIVVLEMYSLMYDSFDHLRNEITQMSNNFQEQKAKLYASNFDRTKRRPIPQRIVMDRYDRLVPMMSQLNDRVSALKRQVKAMDRHDVSIFYPVNRRMFREKSYPAFVQPPRAIPMPAAENRSACVCCSEPANVSIHRSCLWCEDHQCRCHDFILCERCSIHWYWRSSDSFSKSFATCPVCRAEYCLGDIVIYKFTADSEEAAVEPSLSEQIEAQKRKLSELEQQLEAEAKRQRVDSNDEEEGEEAVEPQ